MKMIKRVVIFIIGLVFLPFFFVGFNMIGMKMGLIEIYSEWIDHMKSGEPFGGFDQ